MRIKKSGTKKTDYLSVVQGGQGRDEDNIVEAAMAVLLVITVGVVVMVAHYLINLVK